MTQQSSEKNSPTPANSFVKMILDGINVNDTILNRTIEKLYSKCRALGAAIAWKYKLDEEETEDLIQDSFEVLIKNINNGQFTYNSEGEFYGYIKTILTNLTKNYVRRSSKMVGGLDESTLATGTYELEISEKNALLAPSCSMKERLSDLISEKVTPQGAAILKKSFLDSSSNEKGAAALGYKDESVYRKKKSQHLNDLRSKLTNEEKDELWQLAS